MLKTTDSKNNNEERYLAKKSQICYLLSPYLFKQTKKPLSLVFLAYKTQRPKVLPSFSFHNAKKSL